MNVKPFEADPFLRLKKFALFVLVLLLAGALIYAGYRGYRKFEQTRMIGIAKTAIEEDDLQAAAIPVQRVLQLNPVNLEANRLMGDISDAWNSGNALFWRARAADISSNALEDQLALARTALRMDRHAFGHEVLKSVSEENQKSEAYLELAADAALHSNNFVAAADLFSKLGATNPANPAVAIGLATLLLHSEDPAENALGREELQELADDPALGAKALRLLVTDRKTTMAPEELVKLANALKAHPAADFTDHLISLQVLQSAGDPGFQASLESTMDEVSELPDHILQLANWMTGAGLVDEALDYLRATPAAMRLPAAVSFAHALAQSNTWKEILERFNDQNWESMEFLRFAFLSRANSELGDSTLARAQMSRATSIAISRVGASNELVDLLQTWNQDSEVRSLLWRVVSDSAEHGWALQRLFNFYAERLDTQGLLSVATKATEINPEDKAAVNNRIMFTLLIGKEVETALEDAEKLHSEHPDNPVFTSTYSFALFQNGKEAEALKTLEVLDRSTLEVPQFSAYYGIYLDANGQKAEAREFLLRARTVPLLPEEALLVMRALGEEPPQQ